MFHCSCCRGLCANVHSDSKAGPWSATQPFDQTSEASRGLNFLGMLFILVGLVLVGLSITLPMLMVESTARRGGGPMFGTGYLRSLTPFVTLASMASTFVAAATILSFERSRLRRIAVIFGGLTIAVFLAEFLLSIYLSISRSFAGSVQAVLGLYVLIGLVPFGLACAVLTLAPMVSQER